MPSPRSNATTGFLRRLDVRLVLALASIAFVVTALAYAVVPVLEEKAGEAGRAAPSSPFRDALRRDEARARVARCVSWSMCRLAAGHAPVDQLGQRTTKVAHVDVPGLEAVLVRGRMREHGNERPGHRVRVGPVLVPAH